MTDEEIIELYWKREESAIKETDRKYGAYCQTVASHILWDIEDTKECINDTWLRAWNVMPPQRPGRLRMFLAKITRNLAFDCYKGKTAKKRGGGEIALVLDELSECVESSVNVEKEVEAEELARVVNRFVKSLPRREADVFIRRYFFAETIREISDRYGMTANHISVSLNRTRKKLKACLEKEDYL